MPIVEFTQDKMKVIPASTLTEEKIKERRDLQRVLRASIEAISADLMIIDEEFGDWEDSRRRIDLLALDKDANLVAIELKRTDDGGHMELQAVRYAAMISKMTFEQVVDAHEKYLARHSAGDKAREAILEFLRWDEPDEEAFAHRVRILLLSQDFSKELTTAVLWLNEHGLDIQCVRLTPYRVGERLLLDVQQIIPLPEAEEFQTKIREKQLQKQVSREKKELAERHILRRRFWEGLLERAQARGVTLHANRAATTDFWIGAGAGRSGLSWTYVIWQSDESAAEFYIDVGDRERNKAMFDRLADRRSEIEAAFGGPLEWDRLDEKRGSRIRARVNVGGLKAPQEQWPVIQDAMIDAMDRLHRALNPHLSAIGDL
jgi:hypothetical protein